MVFYYYVIVAFLVCGQRCLANMIWPMPKVSTMGKVSLAINSDFSFSCSKSIPTLKTAFERYEKLTFPHKSSSTFVKGTLSILSITSADYDESHPQLETDESYVLIIPDDGTKATLQAQTIYGVLRGLESFSQLVVFDFETSAYKIPTAPCNIWDSPRFPHRGLMIDTARHFQPLRSIREIIDSLPYAKLNVLHWHMSDSQSFPMQVKSHPKLWDGAHSDQEKFTQTDIASIVEYARERGVRVMVEFDMPGHASSWCTGYPEVCPSPTCTQPLNVATNTTFDLITDLLGECTGKTKSTRDHPSGLFPDNFIHLGGDEVNTGCWTKTSSVQTWMTKHGFTADQAYAYFVDRVAKIAISQGRHPVQWSEVFDHFKSKLSKGTIVHIWKSNTNVTEVVADGYQTLVNVGYNANSWYLDNLNVKWDAVYVNEPCKGVPDSLCPLILGGHGEMWGETVDASDIQQTVWPRLGAIAERLWSPRTINNPKEALPRIEYFRCLLNRRGVRAAPVNNANARSSPPRPGNCYTQR